MLKGEKMWIKNEVAVKREDAMQCPKATLCKITAQMHRDKLVWSIL